MVLPKNAEDKLDGERGKQEQISRDLLDELQTRRELLVQIIKRKWLYLDMHAETISVI